MRGCESKGGCGREDGREVGEGERGGGGRKGQLVDVGEVDVMGRAGGEGGGGG